MQIVIHPVHSGARAAAAGARCAGCAFRTLCLPESLADGELPRLEQIIVRRRRLLRGDVLFQMGAEASALYAVRFGHFKSAQVDRLGVERITGFQMGGELLGIDSIGVGHYATSAVALEDSEVCQIPYGRLQELLAQIPNLLAHFHRILGHEIRREQAAMMFLGNMLAGQRLASFLLNLGQRYAMRGYSSRSFQLRMSREDIGAYLGLTIECVSRQLARFRHTGWIGLDKRAVELKDLDALAALAAGLQPALPAAASAPTLAQAA